MLLASHQVMLPASKKSPFRSRCDQSRRPQHRTALHSLTEADCRLCNGCSQATSSTRPLLHGHDIAASSIGCLAHRAANFITGTRIELRTSALADRSHSRLQRALFPTVLRIARPIHVAPSPEPCIPDCFPTVSRHLPFRPVGRTCRLFRRRRGHHLPHRCCHPFIMSIILETGRSVHLYLPLLLLPQEVGA